MTLDVIATARRRVRRTISISVAVVAALAVLVYAAGLYVNAGLDGSSPVVAPTVGVPWPAGSADAILPIDVTWTALAGVDLPVSATTGPAQTTGSLARGFAHTRAGAVVAALHLLVRTTAQVGPRVFEPTLTDQVVGADAAAMRLAVELEYRQAAAATGAVYGDPLGPLPAKVAGLRMDSATDARVEVQVLTAVTDAAGTNRYAATSVTVSWSEDDWRLLAPPQGRWDALVRLVTPPGVADYQPLRRR
jgi:hypothetical protein